MAAVGYAYIGGATMYYQQYLDTSTGKMLVAVNGQSYSMAPVDPGHGLPVPPGDGRWEGAAPPPPPTPTPPAVQLPQPVVASSPAPAPEGGVS